MLPLELDTTVKAALTRKDPAELSAVLTSVFDRLRTRDAEADAATAERDRLRADLAALNLTTTTVAAERDAARTELDKRRAADPARVPIEPVRLVMIGAVVTAVLGKPASTAAKWKDFQDSIQAHLTFAERMGGIRLDNKALYLFRTAALADGLVTEAELLAAGIPPAPPPPK